MDVITYSYLNPDIGVASPENEALGVFKQISVYYKQ